MKTLKGSRNVVGGDKNPKNLHAYGDKDDVGFKAKLQHPLGLHFVKGKNVVLVADTYNHKIKVIDPFTNEIFSWLGSGEGGFSDDSTNNALFAEPSGIASLVTDTNVTVYIADCNNHCIRRSDYDEGVVETMEFTHVPPAFHLFVFNT